MQRYTRGILNPGWWKIIVLKKNCPQYVRAWKKTFRKDCNAARKKKKKYNLDIHVVSRAKEAEEEDTKE